MTINGNSTMQDLSQSRLGGESTSEPFILLEVLTIQPYLNGMREKYPHFVIERFTECMDVMWQGYGHYVLQDQMLNEPLEEIMGKLLEVNPSEATQLLENRGLYVMPMTLVEGSLHSM